MGDRGGQSGISGLRRVEEEKGSRGPKGVHRAEHKNIGADWVVRRCMGQKELQRGLRGTKRAWGEVQRDV